MTAAPDQETGPFVIAFDTVCEGWQCVRDETGAPGFRGWRYPGGIRGMVCRKIRPNKIRLGRDFSADFN